MRDRHLRAGYSWLLYLPPSASNAGQPQRKDLAPAHSELNRQPGARREEIFHQAIFQGRLRRSRPMRVKRYARAKEFRDVRPDAKSFPYSVANARFPGSSNVSERSLFQEPGQAGSNVAVHAIRAKDPPPFWIRLSA